MPTPIQWTWRPGYIGETWNPTTGCKRHSDGCLNCYIPTTAAFRIAGRRFDGPQIGAATDLQLHPDRLDKPLHWRKPRSIFVNSLSDLFYSPIPNDFIARVFAVMAATPQHTYLLLTKRHARMRYLLGGDGQNLLEAAHDEATAQTLYDTEWPLPNLHLGVSVEHQGAADLRVRALLDTPAAVRWLSVEPMIGPVDLDRVSGGVGGPLYRRALRPVIDGGTGAVLERGLDWIVVGGESGKGARRMDPAWAQALLDQCDAAGVPYYFKQAGAVLAREWGCADKKGGDPAEWPIAFPRKYPPLAAASGDVLGRAPELR